MKKLISIIIACIMILAIVPAQCFADSLPAKGESVRSKDISTFDLSDKLNLIRMWDYDNKTVWPTSDKLPSGFDPTEYAEWEKDPGLGIRALQEAGFNGSGVNVAYIDQPLGPDGEIHSECANVDLHYYTDILEKYNQDTEQYSMHGSAVLSLLAGKTIGVAPKATVYYVAEPSWLADQSTRADAIRLIIQINNDLPADKKIKVIGISNDIQPESYMPHRQDLLDAVAEAEENGIYVLFCGEFKVAKAISISSRNDASNFSAVNWDGTRCSYASGSLYIPTDRTVADRASYYYTNAVGGLSWTSPYAVGLMALGWQINPNLSTAEMLDLMKSTASGCSGNGGLVNPTAFIAKIKSDLPSSQTKIAEADVSIDQTKETESDYYLFVYNSTKLSSDDLNAVKNYTSSFDNEVEYVDVKSLSNAGQVYSKLKSIYDNKSGDLLGIQILGLQSAVPAFSVQYTALMNNGETDRGGKYYSDYFYGNFDNSVDLISNFDVASYFAGERNANLIQQWPVVRLLVDKGEYSAYINKYLLYENQIGNTIPELVNFSNPIFASTRHTDDFSYFISERLDKEFGILNSSQYSLYGNQRGLFPVKTNISGGFIREELSEVNSQSIVNLVINSHGQVNNIDNAIFVKDEDVESYKSEIRTQNKKDNGTTELRISFLNNNNINTVLNTNYYNLMLWTCNNAYGLDNSNLSYTAMAKGEAVNIFAATTIISNNGVSNTDSLQDLEDNNFYYFYYNFFKNYYSGKSISESFFIAKQEYAQAILNHSDKVEGDGNYQFNFNNVLAYEHLGLISDGNTKSNSGDEAKAAADNLYELGLFKGVGTNADGSPIYALEKTATRQEAVTMLVRLLGKEEEALAGNWNIPFNDVDAWAKPYVGYAYANGLTKGTSSKTFGSAENISATQYLTFILRALGYDSSSDFSWDKAWVLTDQLGITSNQYNATSSFIRADIVKTSNKALDVKLKGQNTTLIDTLK